MSWINAIEKEEMNKGGGEGGKAGIQTLVMMGWGRDLLPEGPGPGAKLVSRRKIKTFGPFS